MTESERQITHTHNPIYKDGFLVCNICGECLNKHYVRESIYSIKKSEIIQTHEINHKGRSIHLGSNIDKRDHSFLFKRLREISKRFVNKDDCLKHRIFKTLNNIYSNLEIDNLNVYKMTSYYFEKIYENRDISNNVVLLASCLYMAIKYHNIPISLSQIEYFFFNNSHRVNKKMIIRNCLEFRDFFPKQSFSPSHAEIWITKYINDIIRDRNMVQRMKQKNIYFTLNEYKYQLEKTARLILQQIPKNKRHGSPLGLCGATIYFADRVLANVFNYNKNLKQQEIADTIDITDVTLRNHLLLIKKNINLNILLNNIT